MKWYKRYPSDFIAGALYLSLEESGAYSLLLDNIYARGNVPNDDRVLAQIWNCNVRKARRLKQRLFDLGKVHVEDGFLVNRRAKFEQNIAKTKSLFMQSLAEKRWKNKGNGYAFRNANIESRYKKEGTSEEAVAETPSTTGKVVAISPELQAMMGKKR